MIKFYVSLLFLVFTAGSANAQQLTYTVKLKYKKSSYSLSKPAAFLTQKAINRRYRQHIAIDSTDLPINKSYLDSISNVDGVTIKCKSRWFNQVVIEITDPLAINTINAFSFVQRTHVVGTAFAPQSKKVALEKIEPVTNLFPGARSVLDGQGTTSDTLNYGNNYPQVHIHEGEFLHNQGFQGQGITIAVIDAGFNNYTSSIAFDSVRSNNQILGIYDFVAKDSSVDEDNAHGAYCFSILAANRPGSMVGTAPKASYLLFRSEDVTSEKPVEEQNWIEALERADSMGADMVSSSLGYYNFDDPQYDHSYIQRDGNTTQITIAADIAAKKGMIIMNAAGNTGNADDDSKYILVPADGDSVMTVGAINTSGTIASFSSWGPNGAGKRKPNIVSVGWNAVYANLFGVITFGNGTSYANPNIAGLIACLWQAYPEFTNMEILDAVQRSADKYNNPDDRYGYGIPNFRLAAGILGAKKQELTDKILKGKWITAFPVPFKQVFTVFLKAPSTGRANIRVLDFTGRVLLDKSIDVTQGNHYKLQMNPAGTKRFGMYFVQYNDGKNNSTIKLIGL
ncbi:MAG TPA: S8 family serine peptidase [Flavitalea sp.]|nr:S8 family serine peptidase [Flavitalea sp.]